MTATNDIAIAANTPAPFHEATAGQTRARWAATAAGRVAGRLGQLTIVLLGVTVLTFAMLNLLPGDPAVAVLGEYAAPEALDAFRAEHGLDRPLYTQYIDWLGGAVRGDLGTSYLNRTDVAATIVDRLPVSVELIVLAQCFALGAAIPAAVLAARRPRSIVDKAVSVSAFAGLSLPSFLVAYVLILVFAVHLGWLPATGFTRIEDGLVDNLKGALLPALTLALTQFSVYVRVLRNEMLDTLGMDFVTTAYGKGLPPRRVLAGHVLRGSLLSLLTVVGVNVGTMLGGAVVTETIFGIGGIGRTLMDGIRQRDLPTVQGVVLFVAAGYVVINALVDGLYSLLDPRIRHGNQHS